MTPPKSCAHLVLVPVGRRSLAQVRQSIREGGQWEEYLPSSHADLGLERAIGAGGQPLAVKSRATSALTV